MRTGKRAAKGDRQRRYRSGFWGEAIAAAFLMLKGYRILARRYSCGSGEIDLIAVRGKRLAFIEVKRRASLEAAHASIGAEQAQRITNAADIWLARNARYQTYSIAFDAVFILPRQWPVHVENGV